MSPPSTSRGSAARRQVRLCAPHSLAEALARGADVGRSAAAADRAQHNLPEVLMLLNAASRIAEVQSYCEMKL